MLQSLIFFTLVFWGLRLKMVLYIIFFYIFTISEKTNFDKFTFTLF
jgi:hypothetical protein